MLRHRGYAPNVNRIVGPLLGIAVLVCASWPSSAQEATRDTRSDTAMKGGSNTLDAVKERTTNVAYSHGDRAVMLLLHHVEPQLVGDGLEVASSGYRGHRIIRVSLLEPLRPRRIERGRIWRRKRKPSL